MKRSIFGLWVLAFSAPLALAATESPKAYIAKLDVEIKRAEQVLKSGRLRDKNDQSIRFNTLADEGKQFGESVLDEPYGYCVGAGNMARVWWEARLSESDVDSAWKEYQSQRKACLDAKADAKRNPCLTVYDLNDKGEMVEKPKPAGCK